MLNFIKKILSTFRAAKKVEYESTVKTVKENGALRDFDVEIKRWFGDNGDNTYRLNYSLSNDSVVFDLGGYMGDFADKIYQEHHCNVYLFEPSKEFYERCVERFQDNPKIRCFNFALSSFTGTANLSESADASSLVDEVASNSTEFETVQVREFREVINELKLGQVDLIKINIEGGEYDVLPHLINNGLINKFDNIQVQFHNFIDGAVGKRDAIRRNLSDSHENSWCYDFVWENWVIKTPSNS